MALCDITKGKNIIACKDAVSGLKAIYVANYFDYEFVTESTADGHLLTDIGQLDTVFKYELRNSGNTFGQDNASSRDNGTSTYTQTLNFVLTNISAEMEFQIRMFGLGRPIIFVEGNNGLIFILGIKNGCEVTSKTEIQGTMDSMNGYTLTAVATEKDPVFYLTSGAITALKAVVSTDNL
jgi:hypothetical protein